MICPFCGGPTTTRSLTAAPSDAGRVVRRRRECLKCNKRFTTYERVEESTRLMVIKRADARSVQLRGTCCGA